MSFKPRRVEERKESEIFLKRKEKDRLVQKSIKSLELRIRLLTLSNNDKEVAKLLGFKSIQTI